MRRFGRSRQCGGATTTRESTLGTADLMEQQRTVASQEHPHHGVTTRTLSNTHASLRHCWHPVATADEITEQPVRVWIVGEAIMVCRLDGKPVAFPDTCPHRLAPLSEGRVVNGSIQCPYHGWRFNDKGNCVEIPSIASGGAYPSKARIDALPVIERHGLIFVALEDPLVDLPAELDLDDTWARVDFDPYEGTYGAAMLIDNQLDLTHFPFVHRDTFGSPDAEVAPTWDMHKTDWGFTAKVSVPFSATNDPGVTSGVRPLQQLRTMTYSYAAPFFVDLEIAYPEMGGAIRLVFFAAPQTETEARLYLTAYFNKPDGFTADELAARVAYEQRVVAEDMALQARFLSQAMPIELRDECHVKADRHGIEFRRILRNLVERAALINQSPDLIETGDTARPERVMVTS